MAASSPRRAVAAVNPAEFREMNNQLIKRAQTLHKIIKGFYSDKKKGAKGAKVPYSYAGKEFTSKDITELQRELYKAMRHNNKLYTAGFKRRKGAGGHKGGPNSGFRLPVVMKQELIDFFSQANLGTVAGTNQRLQDALPFLNRANALYGIASRAILTALLSLYAKLNNLSNLSAYNRDPSRVANPDFMNRQLLGADDLMNRVFGAAFASIQRKSAAKLAAMGVGDMQQKPQTPGGRTRHYYRDTVKNAEGKTVRGNMHPIWNDFYHVFSPNNFTYGNFQNIISELTYSTKPGAVNPLPAGAPQGPYLGKVEPELARRYQENVDLTKDYVQGALRAAGVSDINQVQAAAGTELMVRLTLDNAHAVIDRALDAEEQRNPSKSKKSKRSKA